MLDKQEVDMWSTPWPDPRKREAAGHCDSARTHEEFRARIVAVRWLWTSDNGWGFEVEFEILDQGRANGTVLRHEVGFTPGLEATERNLLKLGIDSGNLSGMLTRDFVEDIYVIGVVTNGNKFARDACVRYFLHESDVIYSDDEYLEAIGAVELTDVPGQLIPESKEGRDVPW